MIYSQFNAYVMCRGHPSNINLHAWSRGRFYRMTRKANSINFSYTDLYTSPTQGSFVPKLSYMSPLREPSVASPDLTRRKLSSLVKAALFYSFLFAKLDTRLRSYYAVTNFVTCSGHPSKGWACSIWLNLHDHPSNCKSRPCSLWLNIQELIMPALAWIALSRGRPYHIIRKASSLAWLYLITAFYKALFPCLPCNHFFLDNEINCGSLTLPFHITRFTSGYKKNCSMFESQRSDFFAIYSYQCHLQHHTSSLRVSLLGGCFGTRRVLSAWPYRCLVSDSLKIVTD